MSRTSDREWSRLWRKPVTLVDWEAGDRPVTLSHYLRRWWAGDRNAAFWRLSWRNWAGVTRLVSRLLCVVGRHDRDRVDGRPLACRVCRSPGHPIADAAMERQLREQYRRNHEEDASS